MISNEQVNILLDKNLNSNEKLNLIKLTYQTNFSNLNQLSVRRIVEEYKLQRSGISSALDKLRCCLRCVLPIGDMLQMYISKLKEIECKKASHGTDWSARLTNNIRIRGSECVRKKAIKALLIDDFPYSGHSLNYDLGKHDRVLLALFYALSSDALVIRETQAKYFGELLGCKADSIKPILKRLETKGFIKKLMPGGSTSNLGHVSPVFQLMGKKLKLEGYLDQIIISSRFQSEFYGEEKFVLGELDNEQKAFSLSKVSQVFAGLAEKLIEKQWQGCQFNVDDLLNHYAKKSLYYSVMSKVMTVLIRVIAFEEADDFNDPEFLKKIYLVGINEVFNIDEDLETNPSELEANTNYKRLLVLCCIDRLLSVRNIINDSIQKLQGNASKFNSLEYVTTKTRKGRMTFFVDMLFITSESDKSEKVS